MLARNSDLKGVVYAMEQLERRFNGKFGYPWTFLNEVEFTDEFKRCVFTSAQICSESSRDTRNVTAATKSPVSFGLIPPEHWYQPDWIDEEKAKEGRLRMAQKNMPYAGAVTRSVSWMAGAHLEYR
jgi:alpha 1,2-mannosyltransferase